MRFSPGEADLKAYWGVPALHARVFGPFQGAFEPPCTSDCTFVVISKGPGSTGYEVALMVRGNARAIWRPNPRPPRHLDTPSREPSRVPPLGHHESRTQPGHATWTSGSRTHLGHATWTPRVEGLDVFPIGISTPRKANHDFSSSNGHPPGCPNRRGTVYI